MQREQRCRWRIGPTGSYGRISAFLNLIVFFFRSVAATNRAYLAYECGCADPDLVEIASGFWPSDGDLECTVRSHCAQGSATMNSPQVGGIAVVPPVDKSVFAAILTSPFTNRPDRGRAQQQSSLSQLIFGEGLAVLGQEAMNFPL
jgi:hypothetical protein